ncbi:MAG: sortase [Candidatus Berkelbacteria bacterium]|nr:sortase [Candidatus Berkelbacteria bacterium]
MDTDDIESIIKARWKEHFKTKNQGKNFFKTALKYLLLFILFFVIFYFALNYKSYFIKAKYTYNIDIKKKPITSISIPEQDKNSKVNLPDSIIIDKINVNAPIIWQVNSSNADSKLNEGVIHFAGTSVPSEDSNVVLTGHSSAYPWQKTNYGQVFTLLDKLVTGDKITIIYQKNQYTYEVTNKKIVNPDQVDILSSKEAKLTLITCWPIGTSIKRLVVLAKQVQKPVSAPSELLIPTVP